MWFEFFRFDLRYQLRQPLLWITAFVMALLAFVLSSTDSIYIAGMLSQVNRNAPMVIIQLFGLFSIMSMFIVTLFIAGPILRDTEVGIAEMIFATPMRKQDYLWGRFLAGLCVCFLLFGFAAFGMLIGPYMPWVDSSRVGPFLAGPFVFGLMLFIIPNLLFIGALVILLAAVTRSMMLVYAGIVCFFALWFTAAQLSINIENNWLAGLMDPLGQVPLGRATRYFTVLELNSALPPVQPLILANRLLWSILSLGLVGATLGLFKPLRAGTGRRPFGRKKIQAAKDFVPTLLALPRVPQAAGGWTSIRQCLSILWFDAKGVFKSLPFLVMLLFASMSFLFSVSAATRRLGGTIYPTTHLMIETLQTSFHFMLTIIVTFFAGELVFKERQNRIADVTDAMPIPNWAPLVAKCLALTLIIAGFLATGVLAAVGFQLVRGGVPIEWGLYIKGSLIASVYFLLFGFFALALQVLTNNKFLGYLLVILLMVAKQVLSSLNFEHNLYTFGGLPATPYSDMNGYGHFLQGWAWFAVYWSFFVLAMLIVSQALWVRGRSEGWRRRFRLKPGLGLSLCILGFILSGSWIFYNTNVLNHYTPSDRYMDQQASYEKLYLKYRDVPQPKITAVRAQVDIYPEKRRVVIQSSFSLQNTTKKPIDTLYIQRDPYVETRWTRFPAHDVLLDDAERGFQIVRLKTHLAPEDKLELDAQIIVQARGFTNSGHAGLINYNGTFFSNSDFFPHIGYWQDTALQNRSERKKRGLGELERKPKLENEAARQFNSQGREADWIDFEATVSTSADQIALAPGYLQKSWEDKGRRYFHYKMDRPMINFYCFLSARWEVKRGDWNGIPIEVYYDRKNAYNVDHMIESVGKSLSYYTTHFTPYQHKQFRILEFPQYWGFAQSFANTIPYSEGLGFVYDLRSPDDIDNVFYITAHELAHQWWAHQIVGADMQGSTLLTESLSQYFALMVMEKEYGRAKMRTFLRYESDRYLQSRGYEAIEEQPLYRVENQEYIHYGKGSLVFYRLRNEIGEEALNRALKRYLEAKAYEQPPYTNSVELLSFIRAEAPADKQDLITDLFQKIVLYDNRVTEAHAKKREDGQWDVTFKLNLTKFEANGQGVEKKTVYNEPVELGIFKRDASGETSIWSDHRLLPDGTATVTVTVKDKPYEVGVDPFNIMIDRETDDNRKEITFD